MIFGRPDLVVDRYNEVLIEDTPEKVLEWLQWHPHAHAGNFVAIGNLRQIVTVREYLEKKQRT